MTRIFSWQGGDSSSDQVEREFWARSCAFANSRRDRYTRRHWGQSRRVTADSALATTRGPRAVVLGFRVAFAFERHLVPTARILASSQTTIKGSIHVSLVSHSLLREDLAIAQTRAVPEAAVRVRSYGEASVRSCEYPAACFLSDVSVHQEDLGTRRNYQISPQMS